MFQRKAEETLFTLFTYTTLVIYIKVYQYVRETNLLMLLTKFMNASTITSGMRHREKSSLKSGKAV